MNLRSPLVASASPLSEDLGKIKRLEAAGAAAIVFYSLFEEQLTHVRVKRQRDIKESSPSTEDPFPPQSRYPMTPEAYLDHIRKAKEAVSIPIIASLNCTSIGGWPEYAKQIEQAGADALELNIYHVPTDLYETGAQVERACVQIVEDVRSQVHIPLAVKLGPYYQQHGKYGLAHRAGRGGCPGAVQPLLPARHQPRKQGRHTGSLLSTPQAMRLPLRWIAILYGRVHTDFAATSGIHEAHDVAKMLMVGANVTMLCSALLRRGIEYLPLLERGLRQVDGRAQLRIGGRHAGQASAS